MQSLSSAFVKQGIAAAAVWVAMPTEQRTITLNAFKQGNIHVVTSCGVLAELFDEPRIACIVMRVPLIVASCIQNALAEACAYTKKKTIVLL